MTEVVLVAPPHETANSVERRNLALADRLGISIRLFAQVLEDTVFHATQPRPGAQAIPADQVWVPLGPRNVPGRISALAQDPTNPLVLYAGTPQGGLWQTIDGGDTWEHLGEQEHNFPVSTIAIPEQDSNTLYIGTGLPVAGHVSGRGLYKVTVPPPRIPAPGMARPAAVFERLAPAHPPEVPPAFAARNTALQGASLRYTKIRIDPYDKDRFWAASQSGLWRWEPHPPTGAPRFILEFPADSIASGDGIPPLSMALLAAPDGHYPPYATDLLVARDPRDDTPVSRGSRIPRYLVVYVAIHGVGVYRGRFDRNEVAIAWEKRLDVPNPARGFGRIQLALCERKPERVYALMDDGTRAPTAVYRSDDSGENWRATPRTFDADQTQAEYNLVLEVSPTDPDVVYAGIIDGWLSRNGGDAWQKILFSIDYSTVGDYAQHADQHAAVFDRFERRKLWVGHDGGIAVSRDLQAPIRTPGYWRMRSHGIAAGQFQQVAVNPAASRSFMTGGGAQDAGVWVSFGGPTWLRVNGGDGHGLAFHPVLTRRFLTSIQNDINRSQIVAPTAVRTFFAPVIHDLPETLAPLNALGVAASILHGLTGTPSPFLPLVVQNPAAPMQILFGWRTGAPAPRPDAAYFTTDFGVSVDVLNGLTAAIAPAETEASAACFGPAIVAGRSEGWVGFTNGNLLRTDNAPMGLWAAPATAPPWGTGVPQRISGVVVHPADERIVAVCTSGTPGRVFITYDRGRTWQDLTARVPASIAVTPATVSLAAGQRRQFTAMANFPEGDNFDATVSVEWTSSDPAIARFSVTPGEEGQLIGVAAGSVTVTARANVFGAMVSGTAMATVSGTGQALPLPSAPRRFDLRALPPSPMTSLAFDQTTPTRLFVGTLAGVYLLPDVPSPVSLVITHPASVAVGSTEQFRALCTFSDGVQRDVTTEVDWAEVNGTGSVIRGGPGSESHITGVARGSAMVSASRGRLSASVTVTVTAAAGGGGVLPPPAPAVAPAVAIRWQPFNQGLPLTLVNDITNVPGTNMLRVATFGRGIWDCDLAAATRPRRQLFIRQTIIEDGLTYPRPFPLPVPDDPRPPTGAVRLDHTHAFDIRVDAPPFRFFDGRVDGVEFDERIGADTLVPLVTNSIYVQVHNAGREPARYVVVHLYVRQSPIAAPLGPAPVPLPVVAGADLGEVADFYNFPNFEPVAGASWARAGEPQTLEMVAPGNPVVARFDWAPPATLAGQNVALLALCESPTDQLPQIPAGGPGVSLFIPAERRAALRILPVAALPRPDIYIRGGIDDDGRMTSAAAIRNPHIIVVQDAPTPDARTAFRDLLDPRPQDRLIIGVPNRIYVRVHNRGNTAVRAEVELYAVKLEADLRPDFSNFTLLTPAAAPKLEIDVPANDWELAEVTWTPPTPAQDEAFILIALAKSTDNADPLPVRPVITTEEAFWQFLSRQDGSDNVAARAVKWRMP